MSFLTRLPLNPARRGTRALLASPQLMHAAVLASFPPGVVTADGDARVLWRVDRSPGSSVTLFVASPRRPSMEHVVEQAGWASTPAETRDYDWLLGRLAADQVWAFRVTANPVRHIRKSPQEERTRPRGHVTAAQQVQWLVERSERAGFSVRKGRSGEPDVRVRGRGMLHFDRRGSTVTLATATFDGVLVVENVEQLRGVLTGGLGRARAYGCGLLTLAPLVPHDSD